MSTRHGNAHNRGRRLGGALGTGLLATLVGCAPFNYAERDSPVAQPRIEPLEIRPKIALVLGSGGPRGYAHIGAMRVLEDAGVEYDLVVGSSVGALVGAFWANGLGAHDISRIAQSGGPLTLFDPNPFADRGWIRGQKLQDYVNAQLGNASIEKLRRPLIIVATRREDKAPIFFDRGNVGVAVRASSAMPNIFSPVGIAGVEYEDADESLPVAVSAARQAGAEFVIAIDVSAKHDAAPMGTDASMLERDQRRRQRIDPEVAQADFLIHPDLDYAAGPSRAYFRNAETCGEATARVLLPALLRRLDAERRRAIASPGTVVSDSIPVADSDLSASCRKE
jgi:NTE family protein